MFAAQAEDAPRSIGPQELARIAYTPAQALIVLQRLPIIENDIVIVLVSRVRLWPRLNVEMLCRKTRMPIPSTLVIKIANGFGKLVQKEGIEMPQLEPDTFTLTDLLDWAKSFERTEDVMQVWLSLKPIEDLPLENFKEKWVHLQFERKKEGGSDETEK